MIKDNPLEKHRSLKVTCLDCCMVFEINETIDLLLISLIFLHTARGDEGCFPEDWQISALPHVASQLYGLR